MGVIGSPHWHVPGGLVPVLWLVSYLVWNRCMRPFVGCYLHAGNEKLELSFPSHPKWWGAAHNPCGRWCHPPWCRRKDRVTASPSPPRRAPASGWRRCWRRRGPTPRGRGSGGAEVPGSWCHPHWSPPSLEAEAIPAGPRELCGRPAAQRRNVEPSGTGRTEVVAGGWRPWGQSTRSRRHAEGEGGGVVRRLLRQLTKLLSLLCSALRRLSSSSDAPRCR
jgi:hypothetical protein